MTGNDIAVKQMSREGYVYICSIFNLPVRILYLCLCNVLKVRSLRCGLFKGFYLQKSSFVISKEFLIKAATQQEGSST